MNVYIYIYIYRERERERMWATAHSGAQRVEGRTYDVVLLENV
jgi:hypothetical protein